MHPDTCERTMEDVEVGDIVIALHTEPGFIIADKCYEVLKVYNVRPLTIRIQGESRGETTLNASRFKLYHSEAPPPAQYNERKTATEVREEQRKRDSYYKDCPFSPGDWVRCIATNNSNGITLGKMYQVHSCHRGDPVYSPWVLNFWQVDHTWRKKGIEPTVGYAFGNWPAEQFMCIHQATKPQLTPTQDATLQGQRIPGQVYANTLTPAHEKQGGFGKYYDIQIVEQKPAKEHTSLFTALATLDSNRKSDGRPQEYEGDLAIAANRGKK